MRQYPERPIVAVGAVILDGARVLLVKRANEPLKGQWSLPGGVVEIGETLDEALVREVREETGLDVEVGAVVEVLDRVRHDVDGRVEFHYVIIDYVCRVRGGTATRGSDADAVAWVDVADLERYGVNDKAVAVIRKAAEMPHRGRPTGFDLQPYVVGDLLELRPLKPEDWESLFVVASDPLIWEQHPARDRWKQEVFKEFFREALESKGALAVIDRKTQAIIGSSRYFGFEPTKREIEIGWTFLARSHWGGKYNGELKRLMLDHAFTFAETVVFLVGPTNIRSQKAVEKIGAVMTERRNKTQPDRTTVEQVVYEIKKPT